MVKVVRHCTTAGSGVSIVLNVTNCCDPLYLCLVLVLLLFILLILIAKQERRSTTGLKAFMTMYFLYFLFCWLFQRN